MSTAWRRILTAKMLALSALALALAFVVVAVIHRRHLDHPGTEQVRRGYPPHVKPGW